RIKETKKQIQQENLENKNYFYSGWALKENQMYKKKEEGKHMTETVKKILKSFFYASDKDKSK
ncbi:5287_t:CDS:1, partial [Cetraspora pellucida]